MVKIPWRNIRQVAEGPPATKKRLTRLRLRNGGGPTVFPWKLAGRIIAITWIQHPANANKKKSSSSLSSLSTVLLMDRYERQLFVAPTTALQCPATGKQPRLPMGACLPTTVSYGMAPRYSATSLMPPNSLIHDRGARWTAQTQRITGRSQKRSLVMLFSALRLSELARWSGLCPQPP